MVTDKELNEAALSFMEDECQMTDHFDDYKASFIAGAKWMQEKMKEDIRTLTYMVDEAQTHPVTSGNNYPELVKQADAILAKYESDDK